MVDWVKTGDTRQVLVGENRRCCCLAFCFDARERERAMLFCAQNRCKSSNRRFWSQLLPKPLIFYFIPRSFSSSFSSTMDANKRSQITPKKNKFFRSRNSSGSSGGGQKRPSSASSSSPQWLSPRTPDSPIQRKARRVYNFRKEKDSLYDSGLDDSASEADLAVSWWRGEDFFFMRRMT